MFRFKLEKFQISWTRLDTSLLTHNNFSYLTPFISLTPRGHSHFGLHQYTRPFLEITRWACISYSRHSFYVCLETYWISAHADGKSGTWIFWFCFFISSGESRVQPLLTEIIRALVMRLVVYYINVSSKQLFILHGNRALYAMAKTWSLEPENPGSSLIEPMCSTQIVFSKHW